MKLDDFISEFEIPLEAENGKYFEVFDGVNFKLRSTTSTICQKEFVRLKPGDNTDDPEAVEQTKAMIIEALSNVIVVGVKGIDDFKYSKEAVKDLLIKTPFLVTKLFDLAGDFENFKKQKKVLKK